MRGVIRGHGPQTSYHVDGRQVSREEFDRLIPDASGESDDSPGASLCGWKPLASDALAVHPRQVEEAMRDAQKKGVPTEFLSDGRPILTSRSHRAAYLRAYGFFDRDAGYGDPADGSHRF